VSHIRSLILSMLTVIINTLLLPLFFSHQKKGKEYIQ
jgi:hypothetical protein